MAINPRKTAWVARERRRCGHVAVGVDQRPERRRSLKPPERVPGAQVDLPLGQLGNDDIVDPLAQPFGDMRGVDAARALGQFGAAASAGGALANGGVKV